jgi:hypothetical protein
MHKFWGSQQGFASLITGIVAAVVVAAGLGYYSLVHYAVPKLLQNAGPQLSQAAQAYINGQVKIGNIVWDGGLSVAARDVQVLDQGDNCWVRCPGCPSRLIL